MEEKIKFFLEKKIKCHICKYGGEFLNGYFIKKVQNGVYLLKEDKLGEIHVFISEINTKIKKIIK